jgi:hypothetical protein
MGLHVGIYDHLGWAIAVTASDDHNVVDRRRIELLEQGVPVMPIHHPGKGLSLDEVEALVARVRASAERATAASLGALSRSLPGPVTSMHLIAGSPTVTFGISINSQLPDGRRQLAADLQNPETAPRTSP